MYPQSVLSKNLKIVKKNQQKIVIFTAVKNHCILHGHVFVKRGFAGKPTGFSHEAALTINKQNNQDIIKPQPYYG